MANTYTWDIVELQSYPTVGDKTNVVVAIHWILTGTDGTNTASFRGVQGISFNSDGDFTPYENLTKDQVIAWVHNSLDEDGIAKAQADIDSQLKYMANRPVSNAVPWSE
jgi:hypothetical protein